MQTLQDVALITGLVASIATIIGVVWDILRHYKSHSKGEGD
jgi:hypothetical protein